MRFVKFVFHGLANKVQRNDLCSKINCNFCNYLIQTKHYHSSHSKNVESKLIKNCKTHFIGSTLDATLKSVRNQQACCYSKDTNDSNKDDESRQNSSCNGDSTAASQTANSVGMSRDKNSQHSNTDANVNVEENTNSKATKTWKAIPIHTNEYSNPTIDARNKPDVETILNNQTLESYEHIRHHLETIHNQVMEILSTCYNITSVASDTYDQCPYQAEVPTLLDSMEVPQMKAQILEVNQGQACLQQTELTSLSDRNNVTKQGGTYELPVTFSIPPGIGHDFKASPKKKDDNEDVSGMIFNIQDINSPFHKDWGSPRKSKIIKATNTGDSITSDDDGDFAATPPLWTKDGESSSFNYSEKYKKSKISASQSEKTRRKNEFISSIEKRKKGGAKPFKTSEYKQRPTVVEYVPSEKAVLEARRKMEERKKAIKQMNTIESSINSSGTTEAYRDNQSPDITNKNDEPLSPWQRVIYDPFKHHKK